MSDTVLLVIHMMCVQSWQYEADLTLVVTDLENDCLPMWTIIELQPRMSISIFQETAELWPASVYRPVPGVWSDGRNSSSQPHTHIYMCHECPIGQSISLSLRGLFNYSSAAAPSSMGQEVENNKLIYRMLSGCLVLVCSHPIYVRSSASCETFSRIVEPSIEFHIKAFLRSSGWFWVEIKW